MTDFFPINLRDTNAISRIILTAHDMTLYLHDVDTNIRITDDDAKEILRKYLIEDIEDTELMVCSLGKYTLTNKVGFYVFYATLENI